MKHTLSVLVEDESGVLSRIAGLFARRGFNIESLAVGPAEQLGISRITMVVPGDNRTIEQLIRQLYKLINVLKVQNVTSLACVERELMLLKIHAPTKYRADILDVANIFRARVVDISSNCLILEVTGHPEKTAAIEQLLSQYGIIEISRTGKISLVRASSIDIERTRDISYLKRTLTY